MSNLLKKFGSFMLKTAKEVWPEHEIYRKDCDVSFPENEKFGDISSNLCQSLSKKLQKKPTDIADILIKTMKPNGDIDKTENLNGFVNFTMSKKFWLENLNEIISAADEYGRCDIGILKDSDGNAIRPEKVNLEFCSANPTGPLHLGHVRGAIWGNTLANILKFCGYDVTREYYINDLGGQIEKLVQTAVARYEEVLGYEFDEKNLYYPGEYLKKIGENLKQEFGTSLLDMSKDEALKIARKPVLNDIMKIIKNDLNKLGVDFDKWVYESDIVNSKLIQESFDILKDKDLIYEGILEKPKDRDEEWESKPQMIFASSKLGDTHDRPLRRSDGQWAYFAKDVAYHLDKINRVFDWLILEVGIDHNGYKKRMEAAINSLSDGKQKFSFEFHNMVYLLDDGVQQKMSKRSGNSVGVDEIGDLIGVDVLKFYILSKKHDMTLDFDIKTAREASKNNTYFYVQYAHARCCSIIEAAKKNFEISLLEERDFKDITVTNEEKRLLKKLAIFPNCVESSCKMLEPHKINFYLEELANIFHGIWNLGNCDKSLRFLNDENILMTKYRVLLVFATKQVMFNGLKLIGVSPLEEM